MELISSLQFFYRKAAQLLENGKKNASKKDKI